MNNWMESVGKQRRHELLTEAAGVRMHRLARMQARMRPHALRRGLGRGVIRVGRGLIRVGQTMRGPDLN